jgi:amino acid adenylation domain-containing protein
MTGGDAGFSGDDTRSADDCVHILFTSGSTGAPKGVMVRHRGVARLVFDRNLHPIEPGMAVMHAAPLSFDAATKEIWLPLLNGGMVSGFALRDMLGAEAFSAARTTQPVDIAFFTFALFDALRAQDPCVFSGIARLHVGGEVVQPAAVRAVLEAGYAGSIINSYGPTETTVYALTHAISREDVRADRIPIGRPVASSAAYILDGHGRIVCSGIEGELFLGGDGVALGYLGDAALTEERFVADPFSGCGRLYRTGDKARLRSDGLIEYCGRCDGQIKLRGHRIEPGEIEAVLGAVPGVDQVVVGVHEAVAGDRRLVAWVRPQQPGPGVLAGALEHHLRGVLPDYMVPSWFIMVDEFPRTAHGKLDIAALPPPKITVSVNTAVELSDPLPGILATLREMLINPRFADADSFLAAGGDSLLAVKCAQQIGRVCGVSPPVSLFFENETARRVADYIRVAGWARGLAAPGNRSPATTMRF